MKFSIETTPEEADILKSLVQILVDRIQSDSLRSRAFEIKMLTSLMQKQDPLAKLAEMVSESKAIQEFMAETGNDSR